MQPKMSSGLKTWFVVHAAIDYIFGLPLLLIPIKFMTLLGWQTIDPLTTRLLGAALIAIGTISYITRNEDTNVYRNILKLKITWSVTAILGIILTIIQGAPKLIWAILIIFILFTAIWNYYFIKNFRK